MSFVRRVKSFTTKKSKNDQKPVVNKRKFQRQKSMSLEYLPSNLNLEESDLFRRKRLELLKEDQSEALITTTTSTQLHKRTSVSLDADSFSHEIRKSRGKMGAPGGSSIKRCSNRNSLEGCPVGGRNNNSYISLSVSMFLVFCDLLKKKREIWKSLSLNQKKW